VTVQTVRRNMALRIKCPTLKGIFSGFSGHFRESLLKRNLAQGAAFVKLPPYGRRNDCLSHKHFLIYARARKSTHIECN